MRARTFMMVCAAASLLAACERASRETADQTQPPQPYADTAQRETYTPQGALPSNPAAPPGTVGDGTVGPQVKVEIKGGKLTLSQIGVTPGPVRFEFNNTDSERHVLEISYAYGGRWRSIPVGRGGNVVMAQSLSVGPYEIYCQVPGHKDRGERATFEVK